MMKYQVLISDGTLQENDHFMEKSDCKWSGKVEFQSHSYVSQRAIMVFNFTRE